MLKLENVSFAYDTTPVITDCSLRVERGQAVCLFGPSGCGKTTLLRLIAGLESADNGRIERPDRIAMVFQENRLAPWLTVRENLQLVTDDKAAITAALEAVSLHEDADRYPSELSGGMQRRVALARALAYGGDLLVLDEPFNGLDDALKAQIASALRKRFVDAPMVLVTHSLEEAALFEATVIETPCC